MKAKLSYIIGAALGLIGATACSDYFDTVPGEETTLDKTFASKALTQQYLAHIYSYIPDEHDQRFGGSAGTAGVWTGGCSEAEYSWDFVCSQEINNGAINATSSWANRWWIEYYKGITQANTFLQHIDENNELTVEERERYRNEARALRAIYSFYIFRIYGPFVIRQDVIEPDASADEMNLARNTVDECVNWISDELTQAAAGLPTQSEGEGYWGHITRDIAEAYRAIVWLYAASPLFNGNTYYQPLTNADGTQLFPQTYDATKWQKARDYTKQWLTDYPDYTLTLRDPSGNPVSDVSKADPYVSVRAYQYCQAVPPVEEIIFYRKDGDHSVFYYERTPYHNGASSDYKGGTGVAVTQEIVDLYAMNDGMPIDDSEDYQEYNYGPGSKPYKDYPGDEVVNDDYLLYKTKCVEQNLKRTTFIDGSREVHGMYYNREPRFYSDITFNEDKWLSATAIYSGLAFDGNSGFAIANHDYSHSGYVVRKGATTGAWGSGSGVTTLLRVAELYLNYAEALCECANAGIGGTDQYEEALSYVNLIRARAGIPGYALTDGKTDARNKTCINITKLSNNAGLSTYEQVRNVIRHERTIELAFENNRYFDVRRWKVSTMENGDGWVYPLYHQGGEGGEFWGMDSQSPELSGFYNKKVFETRVYSERANLFPIPQADINRSDLMRQNTGWSSVD
jgi:hypothetical protein